MTRNKMRKKSSYIIISLLLISCLLAASLFFTIKKYRELKIENAFLALENESLKNPIEDQSEDVTETIPSISDAHDIEGLSAYQKLAQGQPINLLVVGDSISTYPWDVQIQEYLKEKYGSDVTIDNRSLTGNSSYSGYVQVEKIPESDELGNPITYDLAIICHGQNDEDAGFSTNYEMLIRSILSRYEGCNIVCVQEASQMNYTDRMLTIASIADYYQLQLADVIGASAAVTGGNIALLTEDNVHPNEQGCAIYAQTVEAAINDAVSNNICKKSMPSPINPEQNSLGKFHYYEATEFKRADKVYEMSLTEPINGVLGYDIITTYGDNGFTLIVDGQTEYKVDINGYNEAPLVNMIGNPENGSFPVINATKSIVIVFNTNPQADRFNGLYFSDVK